MSREKVREYALATGAGSVPEGGDVVAPPTFAACFTLDRGGHIFSDTELGAHPNLVHGSQEYEFHRPLRVGDALVCEPRITDVALKGRMDVLTYETSCRDERSGEPVVTATTVIIFFNPAEG